MAPTIRQQTALEYAPKPFALVSLLASVYVACHLLVRRREKLGRLYHRLALAMNLALAARAVTLFCGSWAVPAGTPGYVGAAGTVASCTLVGFVAMMLTNTIPIYYVSLGLQASLAIKRNFREESYAWIEKWIHLVAWAFPCGLISYVAATENINPSTAVCWLARAPRGCELDPGAEVPCERGSDIAWVVYVLALGQIAFYLVLPPAAAVAVSCRLRRTAGWSSERRRSVSRKQLLRSAQVQMAVYVVCFWATNFLALICEGYYQITGDSLYNLLVVAKAIYSSQGLVIAMVYFALEKIGHVSGAKWGENSTHSASSPASSTPNEADAAEKGGSGPADPEAPPTVLNRSTQQTVRGSFNDSFMSFNVFDVTLEGDSPWAEFFVDDEGSGAAAGPAELPPQLRWRPEEGDADKGIDLRTKIYLFENVLRL